MNHMNWDGVWNEEMIITAILFENKAVAKNPEIFQKYEYFLQ